MSAGHRPSWLDSTADQWRVYRDDVAAWLDAHPDTPNTVMRRCLAMADRHLERLGAS